MFKNNKQVFFLKLNKIIIYFKEFQTITWRYSIDFRFRYILTQYIYIFILEVWKRVLYYDVN